MQARLEALTDLWLEYPAVRLGCLGLGSLALAFLVGTSIAILGRGSQLVSTFLTFGGFLVFAIGLVWFSLTVLLDRPVKGRPGGFGLLALALGGLLLMVVGMLYPTEVSDAATDQAALAASASRGNEMLDESSTLVDDLKRSVASLTGRLEEKDRQIAELRSQLESTKAPGPAPEEPPGGMDAGSALVLSGPVTAHAAADLQSIDYVTFEVGIAGGPGGPVDLSDQGITVSYVDANQGMALRFQATSQATSTLGWSAKWLSDSGPLLNPGERVEIEVILTGLASPLGANSTFAIEMKPAGGDMLVVAGTTPGELTSVMELK